MDWTPYRIAVVMDGKDQVSVQNCFTGATEIQIDNKRYRRIEGEDKNPLRDSEGRYIFTRVDAREEKFIQNKWIPENYGPEAEKRREERYTVDEDSTEEDRGQRHRKVAPREDKRNIKRRS